MAEILETAMLICFGFSWPMSVYKNIKAHTAKSMSLQFILLIITGYIAGIVAKLYTHRINYVLVVYMINLVMVSINLVVYFINRRYDSISGAIAEAPAPASAIVAPSPVRPIALSGDILNRFKEMNRLSRDGGAVFFGSSTFSHIPMCELAMDSGCEIPVHNRSIDGLSIVDVESVLNACVLDLNPRMVFVNIGEADLSNSDLVCDDFMNRYEWLLYTLHSQCRGAIHIVSILSDSPLATELNARLKKMAEASGCAYIDAIHAIRGENSASRIFNCMKAHMHTHTISLEEAMLVH